ncbi:hypothetical protein KIN20_019031 [Parelaphostrongylus tenuis]|uniref:Uncharacterized protein n=1 Tax=Parelaphostrongylus tenuis TaxID=148309 RepID=A0AAD5MNV1_PARTN|nr:hypothetical protein KIN20_019031 [Parelaphostrongylus tenuis]
MSSSLNRVRRTSMVEQSRFICVALRAPQESSEVVLGEHNRYLANFACLPLNSSEKVLEGRREGSEDCAFRRKPADEKRIYKKLQMGKKHSSNYPISGIGQHTSIRKRKATLHASLPMS